MTFLWNYRTSKLDSSDIRMRSAATTVVPHSFFEYELKTYASCILSQFFLQFMFRVLPVVCFKELFMIFCWAGRWSVHLGREWILFPQVKLLLVQRVAFTKTFSLVGSLGISISDQVHNCVEDFNCSSSWFHLRPSQISSYSDIAAT